MWNFHVVSSDLKFLKEGLYVASFSEAPVFTDPKVELHKSSLHG